MNGITQWHAEHVHEVLKSPPGIYFTMKQAGPQNIQMQLNQRLGGQ